MQMVVKPSSYSLRLTELRLVYDSSRGGAETFCVSVDGSSLTDSVLVSTRGKRIRRGGL